MKRATLVTGLQWGSEAKGNIVSAVATALKPDTTVSAWHPNAGHTAVIDGKKYIHSMLPIAALCPSVKIILLGPGTVLDIEKLAAEVAHAGPLLEGKQITIHPNATILSKLHAELEQVLVTVGSTMKGSAQAVMAKMMRGASGDVLAREHKEQIKLAVKGVDVAVDEMSYFGGLAASDHLMVEGAQGYGLGINTKFWPHCTSRDVTTAQIFADCRIPISFAKNMTTIGVCRTYPIRVANRFKDGIQVGTSGGCYDDQRELDWKQDLGREPEMTTVTKLPRRIFSFSREQISEAAYFVEPTTLALTFADYVTDIEKYMEEAVGTGLINWELRDKYFGVSIVSKGPEITDVYAVNDTNGKFTLTRFVDLYG